MPNVNPTSACTTSDVMNAPVSFGRTGLVMWCAAASARDAATPTFTVVGIMRVLNGGAMNNQADARTRARTNAVTTTVLIGIVMGSPSSDRELSALQQLRNHVEQRVGERNGLSEHPVSGEQDHDGDTRQFGHERECLFLDLSG